MSAVESIMRRQRYLELKLMRQKQERAELIHKAWVLEFSNLLVEIIRLHDRAEDAGTVFRRRFTLTQLPRKNWCLAAYTLLVFGSTELRHAFLMADDAGKDRIVETVGKDGYVVSDFGQTKEILP